MGLTTIFLILCSICTPLIQPCHYKAAVEKRTTSEGSFEPMNLLKYDRKPAAHPCICGEHFPGKKGDPTSYSDQKWILYIQFKLVSGIVRLCLGTIINSNMVITSHRCLLKGDKPSVSEIFKAKLGKESHFAGINDITLLSRSGQSFPVKKIIYSERFAYDYAYESAPESDVAILIVDFDFNDPSKSNTNSPICVPRFGQIATQKLVGSEGYYQGIRTWEGSAINYQSAISNFSKIRTADYCHIHGRLPAKPTSNESLCLMFTFPGPTIEGGPLRIVAQRMIGGGGWRDFLVGIATWTGRNETNARHKYAYFANINSIISYIEHHANLHGSEWCPTPHPDEESWPWEFFDGEVDRSLNCECGYQPESDGSGNGRIIGGEYARHAEFPWLVKFFIKTKIYNPATNTVKDDLTLCGGSIINDRMIMTAAHCFVWGALVHAREDFNVHFHPDNESIHEIFIHSWFTRPKLDGQYNVTFKQVFAKKIIFHPGYVDELRESRTDFDIALIVLNESLTFAKVENTLTGQLKKIYPVCLPEPGYLNEIVGQNATVSGWGSEDTDGTLAVGLKKLSLPIRNQSECLAIDWQLGQSNLPTDTRVCASYLHPEQTPGKIEKVLNTIAYLDNIDDSGQQNISTTYFTNVEAFLPYIYYYSKENGGRFCERRKKT